MKIKYDMSNRYNVCYNESLGVATHKREVLNGKKVHNYTSYGCMYLIAIILVIIADSMFYYFTDLYVVSCALTIFSIILVLLIIVYFMLYYIRRNMSRCRKRSGYLDISDEGITDESFMGIKMIFHWEKIHAVVVGKEALIILTDTPVYFFLDNSIKDEVINNFKKYKSDISIIEKR